MSGELVWDWLAKEPIACGTWDGRAVLLGGQSGDLIVRDMAAGVTLCRVMAHPSESFRAIAAGVTLYRVMAHPGENCWAITLQGYCALNSHR